MAFGFIGIETITVVAYEAKRPDKDLRQPSKYTIYFAVGLYLLCMFAQCLNVSWTNDRLPTIYGGINVIVERALADSTALENPSSHVVAVIAMFNWGKKTLAGILNAGIIFSVLSAGNTTLYVSSRTLYGMALLVKRPGTLGDFARSFSTVHEKTRVPVQALLTSFGLFFWVPFMSLKKDYKFQYVSIVQTL